MSMIRNPVTDLMELAQKQRMSATFEHIFTTGQSHQPRFLCQWQYGDQVFPAVFGKSKKDGKTLAAQIALEELRIRGPEKTRRYVTFKVNDVGSTLVDESTTIGLDPSMFTPHFQSTTNAAVRITNTDSMRQPLGTPSQDYRLDPTFLPQQRMPRPLLAKKMTAFDEVTIDALGLNQPRSIFQSPPVAARQASAYQQSPIGQLPSVLTREASAPPPQQSAVTQPPVPYIEPAAECDSFGLSATLASLKLEGKSESADGWPRPMDVTSGVHSGSNPISALYELGQKIGVTPTFQVLTQSGQSHQPVFVCKCVFGNKSAVLSAPSKDKGKLAAFSQVFAQMDDSDLAKSSDTLANGQAATNEVTKNPISAVMELGVKMSILPEFEVEQLSQIPISRFRGYCLFGDKRFGPAEAQSKQETKTAAFRMAWDELNDNPSVMAELSRLTHGISSSTAAIGLDMPSTSGPSSINQEDIRSLLSQKHPMSTFLEYAQARGLPAEFVEVDDTGPAHCRRFTYRCSLAGRSFPEAAARTKKEAKKNAAELALRSLCGSSSEATDATQSRDRASLPRSLKATTSNVPEGPLSKSDIIAQKVLTAFNSLKANCSVAFGKIILAGFVVENVDRETFTAVSVGTGNKCITGTNLALDGTSVNDCHAEVIARRGLLRFFYRHLKSHKGDVNDPIFEKVKGSTKLRFKANLRLHLYISTAPCGDGAVFTHNDANNLDTGHVPSLEGPSYGYLRSKLEDGEGTIPTGPDAAIQTCDGIAGGGRLRTMSCSDKICKWNVLGVQGTLLSQLIEPVYIERLILGQLFSPGHLSRALCCRVTQLTIPEDSKFKVNHVELDCPSKDVQTERSTAKSKPVSLNWMMYDESSELLTAETGQVIPSGLSNSGDQLLLSRVSRKRLYNSFKKLSGSTDAPGYYRDAKAKVKDYCELKLALYAKFSELKYGTWVRKPEEHNMFG